MKLSIVLINIEPQKAASLAATRGYQVGVMPFRLPLGTTRPTVEDYLPLMNKIERRMMGMNKLLTYSGRLVLVNSVLSSMPTFYLCTLRLPITVLDQIDRYRKHML